MFCRVLNSITSSGAGVHIPARPLGLGAHIASPWGSVPAPGIGPRPAGRSPSGKAGAAADAEDPSRTQREELKWEMGKPSRKRGAWSPAAGAKRVAAQRDRLWSCLQASCDRQHTGLPAALSGQRDVPCAVSWRQNAGPPWLAPRTDRTGDQPGEERGRRARGRPPGVPRVRRDPRAGPPAGLHLSSSEARGSPAPRSLWTALDGGLSRPVGRGPRTERRPAPVSSPRHPWGQSVLRVRPGRRPGPARQRCRSLTGPGGAGPLTTCLSPQEVQAGSPGGLAGRLGPAGQLSPRLQTGRQEAGRSGPARSAPPRGEQKRGRTSHAVRLARTHPEFKRGEEVLTQK